MRKIVFILSLPRAGSTLLLRQMLRHPEVRAVSEGWFLLPAFYASKPQGTMAAYRHGYSSRAIGEIINALPRGNEDFNDAIRAYAQTIYDRIGSGGSHVVDKTPPYSLITSELMECFPDAHFIFLWRDPISIIGSFVKAAGHRAFNIEKIRAELYLGLGKMCRESTRPDRKILNLNYEKFCGDPAAHLRRIFAFVGLDPDAPLADLGSIQVPGSLGDTGELRASQEVRSGRDGDRRAILGSPLRRRFLLKYLNWIGADRCRQMGYDLEKLCADVRKIPGWRRYLLSDLLMIFYPKLDRLFLLSAVRKNLIDAKDGRMLFSMD
jgi:hypothetical protein